MSLSTSSSIWIHRSKLLFCLVVWEMYFVFLDHPTDKMHHCPSHHKTATCFQAWSLSHIPSGSTSLLSHFHQNERESEVYTYSLLKCNLSRYRLIFTSSLFFSPISGQQQQNPLPLSSSVEKMIYLHLNVMNGNV